MSDKPTRPTAAAAGVSEEEGKGVWAGLRGAGQAAAPPWRGHQGR